MGCKDFFLKTHFSVGVMVLGVDLFFQFSGDAFGGQPFSRQVAELGVDGIEITGGKHFEFLDLFRAIQGGEERLPDV